LSLFCLMPEHLGCNRLQLYLDPILVRQGRSVRDREWEFLCVKAALGGLMFAEWWRSSPLVDRDKESC
jgi:hypothetical protein